MFIFDDWTEIRYVKIKIVRINIVKKCILSIIKLQQTYELENRKKNLILKVMQYA